MNKCHFKPDRDSQLPKGGLYIYLIIFVFFSNEYKHLSVCEQNTIQKHSEQMAYHRGHYISCGVHLMDDPDEKMVMSLIILNFMHQRYAAGH